MAACRICGNTENNRPTVGQEMMFGTRERYPYFQCAECGCLQIGEIPTDLARHYPDRYYSFQPAGRMKRWIKGQWLSQELTPTIAVKRLLHLLTGRRQLPTWIQKANVDESAAILDVGCGNGVKLLEMGCTGYRDLTGVDEYLPSSHEYPNGVLVLKQPLSSLSRRYDLIMLHHSLEHMPDQVQSLRELHQLLQPGGKLLVRIPVFSPVIWKRYGPNWVQMDPPRHLYLHTEDSLTRVAEAAGYRIVDRWFDSTAYQFWGSELIARGISLRKASGSGRRGTRSFASTFRRPAQRRASEALNRAGLGDSAGFILQPSPGLGPQPLASEREGRQWI